MNPDQAPPCLNCGNPVPIPTTGRPRKFCKQACKSAWARSKGVTSPPATSPSPEPTEDIYDHLPFEIAVYMPVQPWQTKDELMTMGKATSEKTKCPW